MGRPRPWLLAPLVVIAALFRPSIHFTRHDSRLVHEARQAIVPLLCLAGALLVAVISELLYRFVERRKALRWCGALGVMMAVFYGLIAVRWLYNVPYDWHSPRLIAITVTLAIVGVLLTCLLLEQFAVPRRRWWLAALAPLLVGAWAMSAHYETKSLWICRGTLAVALAVAAWAAWHRRHGARPVLVGGAIGLFAVQASGRTFLSPTFFLIFEGMVLFVFATIGVQVQADRARARAAELTAARLETELLKKNIQPHFLLNTLASIIEVIEQEPKAAVAFIEALAGEFRILARVAGEKLIPLGQEIALCEAHLQVMSLRRGVRCKLDLSGVDESEPVPPALFHTLIENGLTHLPPKAGEQRFELRAERERAARRYVLLAHGTRGPDPAWPRAATPLRPPSSEGTGTRYIKARLEESFTGRWSVHGGPVPEGWETMIKIGAAGRPPAASLPAAGTRPLPAERLA